MSTRQPKKSCISVWRTNPPAQWKQSIDKRVDTKLQEFASKAEFASPEKIASLEKEFGQLVDRLGRILQEIQQEVDPAIACRGCRRQLYDSSCEAGG